MGDADGGRERGESGKNDRKEKSQDRKSRRVGGGRKERAERDGLWTQMKTE